MPTSQLSGPDYGTSNLLEAGLLTRSRHSGPMARAGRSAVYLEHLALLLVALYVVAGALVYARLGDRSYLQRLLVPQLSGQPRAPRAVRRARRPRVPPAQGSRARRAENPGDEGGLAQGMEHGPPGPLQQWPAALRRRSDGRVTALLQCLLGLEGGNPGAAPISRDILFATMDARLHGGPPHRLLAWIPLQPLDLTYFFARGEMLVLTLVILGVASQTEFCWRSCYVDCAWNWSRVAGSSAGPPYFLALTGRDTYAGLIAHLAVARDGGPIHRLAGAALALVGPREPCHCRRWRGSSAFPSMHVAVPALLAFATWRRSRILSVGLAAFTLLILVSSVALGWHYAVDGYASILGSGIIWLLVARLPIPEAFGPAGDRMRA